MNRIPFTVLILLLTLNSFSQENESIEFLKNELYKIEKKGFDESDKPILANGRNPIKFKMEIENKYWNINNRSKNESSYIFRVKKYDIVNGNPFFQNILLNVKNKEVLSKYIIPNNNEIIAIATDKIEFKNETLIFENGEFHEKDFFDNKKNDKYRFISEPLLKNSKSGLSANGLNRSEKGLFDGAEFRIKTSSTDEENLDLEIFFESIKPYKKTKERKKLLITFVDYLNNNSINESHQFWLKELKNKLSSVTEDEIEKIKPWDGIKYDLGNGFKSHLYFLLQTDYTKSKKGIKVNKLMIELKK